MFLLLWDQSNPVARSTLYENSKKALTIKRLADKQRANEILAMKAHLLSQNNNRDRGNSNRNTKKTKREREREQEEQARPGSRACGRPP